MPATAEHILDRIYPRPRTLTPSNERSERANDRRFGVCWKHAGENPDEDIRHPVFPMLYFSFIISLSLFLSIRSPIFDLSILRSLSYSYLLSPDMFHLLDIRSSSSYYNIFVFPIQTPKPLSANLVVENRVSISPPSNSRPTAVHCPSLVASIESVKPSGMDHNSYFPGAP